MINGKVFFQDFLLTISIIASIMMLGFIGMINLLPILLVVISLILVLIKKSEMVLILFLISMTTNNIIPKEKFIAGFIGVQQALALFSFVLIFKRKKTLLKFNIDSLSVINKTLKFILLYTIYTVFKNAYFDIFEANFSIAITRAINFSFLMYIVYLILNKMENSRAIFFRACISIVIFLGITAFLSKYLILFGYYISIDGESLDRYNGFTGNGDANTLALIMVIGVAVLLNYSIIYRWEKIFTLPLIISLTTIGLTGSRSGLILLLLVVIFYFIKQRDFKKIVRGFFALVIIVILSFPLFKTNLERLKYAKTEQTDTEGTSNRIGKWIAYFDYFSKNPESVILGADKEIEIGWNGTFLVSHNIYIQIVYNSGIFFLLYFITLLFRIYLKRRIFKGHIIMMFFPLIMGIGFLSDYGAVLFYAFAIAPFISMKQKKNKWSIVRK